MAKKTARFEVRLTAKEDRIVRTKAEDMGVDRSEFAKLCILNSKLINIVKPPLTLTVELQIIDALLEKGTLSKQEAKNCIGVATRYYERKESEHADGIN